LFADRRALLAMVDAHGGKDCPDAELRIEVFEKLCVHRDMYMQDVEGERLAWADTCEAFGVAPDDKQGGWQERDHLIYTKVWKEVSSKRAGVDRGKLLTRLALELPSKSSQELEAHDAWYRARRQHATRLKDLEEVMGGQSVFESRLRLVVCNPRVCSRQRSAGLGSGTRKLKHRRRSLCGYVVK
jgi:hypothetical protein